MVKGTISFHLNDTDRCQAFFSPKGFLGSKNSYAVNDDKNHGPDKASVHPIKWPKCILIYFVLFLFSSQFEFQKFGRVLLEELGFVVVFLVILVTDQCTYFKRFIHVLYEQGASKMLCITYNIGAGFFDASNVKETLCGMSELLAFGWNYVWSQYPNLDTRQRLWGIKLNKLHVLIALCTFLHRTNKELSFHLQFLICSYVNYPSTKLAI